MGKKNTLRDHASHLGDTLAPHVETARDKAGPALADARDKAVPVLTGAAAKAVPVLVDARDKAAPVISEARDKAAPVISEARDRFTTEVLPVVTAALTALDDATEDARSEALRRGKAVAAALKGELPEPEQRKRHRVRALLIALGLGGAAFAVAKRFTSRQPTTDWQSSYTPPPAPSTAPAAAPVTDVGAHRADRADDVAAADPAEAASDSTDVPHQATTPDTPATEIDVDPVEKP
jgi:vacuolar-type H+-ATPase subunit H